MRLRLVERKNKLNEDFKTTLMVGIKIFPADFVKLTSNLKTYSIIKTFIENNDIEEVLKLSGKKDTRENRKTKISDLIGNVADAGSAIDILNRAIELKKPLPQSIYGAYDPKKAGDPSLVAQDNGDQLKIIKHEGRARTVYRWMNGESDKISATINFTDGISRKFADLPPIIISEIDDRLKVLKRDLEADEAGLKDKYIFVEFESEYEGSKLIRTDAFTSTRLFSKTEVSNYMRFDYPGRLMFRLKPNKPESLPTSKQELLNNFELVTDPKSELNINAASGSTAQKILDSLPSKLITRNS